MEKASTGIRLIEIILGVITVVLSSWVISNPDTTTLLFITLLGIALIMVGISKIIAGIVVKQNVKSLRVISIVIGVVSIIGGSIALVNPISAVMTLIMIISIFILIHGLGLIISGIISKGSQKNLRIAYIVLGVIAVAFAGIIHANPEFAITMTIVLISLGLLFNGLASIISGIIGVQVTKI